MTKKAVSLTLSTRSFAKYINAFKRKVPETDAIEVFSIPQKMNGTKDTMHKKLRKLLKKIIMRKGSEDWKNATDFVNAIFFHGRRAIASLLSDVKPPRYISISSSSFSLGAKR